MERSSYQQDSSIKLYTFSNLDKQYQNNDNQYKNVEIWIKILI